MDLRKAPSINSFKTKLDALIMKEAREKFLCLCFFITLHRNVTARFRRQSVYLGLIGNYVYVRLLQQAISFSE